MPTWIAFQRAVNVGGRRYPMAELRAVLEDTGFTDVETHIQTGNIRLTSPLRSAAKVSSALEELFKKDRGFEVATIVFTPAELAQIAADADTLGESAFHYVELMRETPSAAAREIIEGQGLAGQRNVVKGRAAHLLFDMSFSESKPANAAVKRAFGDSTNRNAKVIRTLAKKWGG